MFFFGYLTVGPRINIKRSRHLSTYLVLSLILSLSLSLHPYSVEERPARQKADEEHEKRSEPQWIDEEHGQRSEPQWSWMYYCTPFWRYQGFCTAPSPYEPMTWCSVSLTWAQVITMSCCEMTLWGIRFKYRSRE